MSLRQILSAWLAAVVILAGALLLSGKLSPAQALRFEQARVVAVGSSLMTYGWPERGVVAGGKSFRRIGIAVPAEDQLLLLAEQAIGENAEVLLLEVTPFIADFKFETGQQCHAPAASFRRELHIRHVALVDRFRQLVGARSSLDGMIEPAALDRGQTIDPQKLATFYPLTFHGPCDPARLGGLIDLARTKGTKVVLVLPPRSPMGESVMGGADAARLRTEAEGLAARLEIPLFAPLSGWQDGQFVDHAHLNAQGRARFMAELNRWLEANI